MTLIVLHISFSGEVTLDPTSICEILRLKSRHCGIVTTNV